MEIVRYRLILKAVERREYFNNIVLIWNPAGEEKSRKIIPAKI